MAKEKSDKVSSHLVRRGLTRLFSPPTSIPEGDLKDVRKIVKLCDREGAYISKHESYGAWCRYSEVVYCAGFMDVSPWRVHHFLEWLVSQGSEN